MMLEPGTISEREPRYAAQHIGMRACGNAGCNHFRDDFDQSHQLAARNSVLPGARTQELK